MLKFRVLKADLKGVEEQLKRLNTLLEAFLASQGVKIGENASKTAENAPSQDLEVSYTDPELLAIREFLEKEGKIARIGDEIESEELEVD